MQPNRTFRNLCTPPSFRAPGDRQRQQAAPPAHSHSASREPVAVIAEAREENTSEELMRRAKRLIQVGDSLRADSFRAAADAIALAFTLDEQLTQRKVALAVGKSAAWVNRLLKWREGGYVGAPFADQVVQGLNKNKRLLEQALLGAERVDNPETLDVRETTNRGGAQTEANIDGANDINVEIGERAAPKKLPDHERARLIETLRFLATEPPRSRAAFALSLEKRRAMLGLTWDELLIPASSEEDDSATNDVENAIADMEARSHSSDAPDIPEFLRRDKPTPTFGQGLNEWHRFRGFILALDLADRQRLIAERVAPFVAADQAKSAEPQEACLDVAASTEREEPAQ